VNPKLAILDYVILSAYVLFLILVGYYFSRQKKQTTAEYLLGSRRIPWWAAGISTYVALMSTLSLVAVPGEAFNHGISLLATSFISPFCAIAACFIFLRFYFKAEKFTPYSYLENRFDIRVKTFTASMFWIMRLMYLGVVLYSCAKVFEGAAGWSPWFSILLIGIICIIYTFLGGLKAVIWTDVTQFVIIFGALVLVLVMVVVKLPFGLVGIIDYSFKHGRGFEYFKDPNFYGFSPFIRLNLWVLIFSAFVSEMFNYSADQTGIQKLLSTSSYKQAKKSVFTYAVICLPISILSYLIGLAVFAFYSHNPLPNGLPPGDLALFHFISTQLRAPMPGLIIAGFLAAAMTTLGAGLNGLATVATKDFYLQYFTSAASEQRQVNFSKISTAVVGVLVVGIGLIIASANQRIGQTMIEVASLWFAYFTPIWVIFLLGVTTTRITAKHIFVCIGLSWVFTTLMIIWYLISKDTDKPLSFMLIGLPGTMIMIIIGYLFACFSKPLDSSKTSGLTLWTLNKKGNPEPDVFRGNQSISSKSHCPISLNGGKINADRL